MLLQILAPVLLQALNLVFPILDQKLGHEPTATFDIEQFVTGHGYPFEKHEGIVTTDGYILTLHRIPHGIRNKGGKSKGAVLLMHGIFSLSDCWVLTGPGRALAFILADLGYDVWLGNTRGNMYSKYHIKYKHGSKKFWNFSWHEIGIFDLPAMIDYILYKTGEKSLYYIGHSQGTTTFFVMSSTRPEYNRKIRLFIALAPVAYMRNAEGPIPKMLAPVLDEMIGFYRIINQNELLHSKGYVHNLAKRICNSRSDMREICANALFLTIGANDKELDRNILPLAIANHPAEVALKQGLHYAQSLKKGTFSMYDYGVENNRVIYGYNQPPPYNMSRATAPMALCYSENDFLSGELDVKRIFHEIPNGVELYKVPQTKFNHMDFLWARNVVPLLYKHIIDLMRKY